MDSDSDFEPHIDESDDESWELESETSDSDEITDTESDITNTSSSSAYSTNDTADKTSPKRARSPLDGDDGPPRSLPPFRPGRVQGFQLPDEIRTRTEKSRYLSVVEFFQMFFTLDVVGRLCEYTNESAHTTGISKPEMYKGWFDVEPEEFYRFLALLMYMGILPAPSVERFYSAKSLYNGLWARAFMEKKRFQQLLSFLKVSNREREDPKNKLAKVTFLLEFIQRRCQNLFQPGRNLAIDERMVRNKGRYSFRQYIRDKPTKWGMKLWVIADPETGYTYNFDVYLGKDTGMQGDGGLAYNVVMKLVKRLAGKGYRIFFDNFYTTLKLLKDLFMIGIGACGTILSNRRGFPTELKNVKEFEKGSKRGDYRWSRDEEVLTVQWRDNKTISVMSTFHEANSTVKVTRRTKVDNKFERIEVKQPIAIKDYNKYMGGVDRSDQLINKYHGLRKTNKFWKTLFLHMIDISRVNSYILFNDWRSKNKDVLELRRPNRYTQLDFTEELIRDLAKIALYAQVPVASMHIYHVCHSIIPVVSAKRRNCKLCYDKYQQEKKTNVKCDGCGVHLCFVKKRNCLLAYHTR